VLIVVVVVSVLCTCLHALVSLSLQSSASPPFHVSLSNLWGVSVGFEFPFLGSGLGLGFWHVETHMQLH
jgi:hypothetical protein